MNPTVPHELIHPINENLNLHLHREWIDELTDRSMRGGPWDDFTMFQLAYEAEQANIIDSFDDLLCLRHIGDFKPMPHQIDTAKKALHGMRGRAILADEVGLGKTIEAGLVLKEYMIRGLVRKALILVPASLVLQWVRELNQKFGISATAQKKEYMWTSCDVIVASMDTAKREPHRAIVLGMDYDMVIIDEAHKLKNKKTTNYQFVCELRKKYCLLLTATPIQNDLQELYNLITVLKPGQLGVQSSFQENYIVDKRTAKNEGILQQELSKVMIRNRRSDGNLELTKRHVRNFLLTLSPDEQALYDGVSDYVRGRYEESKADMTSVLSLVTLQREVCSSRDAVFHTLVNLSKKIPPESPQTARIWELVELIRSIKSNTKADKVLEIISGIEDKVIIFTEYRASQEYLMNFLKQHNIASVPYRGGMNRGKKDWMMDLFKSRAKVLIATEAGCEGINLQFCHHMINFDLPWNPMRVEQRIGRVHRLGQQYDVNIYNLSTKGTIEEHILNLLHEKINMFESVIGELDVIVERIEKKSSLEASLFRLAMEARSSDEFGRSLDQIGEKFQSMHNQVEEKTQAGAAFRNILSAAGESVEMRP